ncbi:tRNA (guanosine(18)-2'-O)-methyltransferase TrmH [Gayadomonas joobiniege]|uniref:tRNA (guanosine(18)-2'-O)-methyltransferase TrmH n=1 Tax=Gayadomonas joobiniege TaxID=1234606 RepID=UPI0003783FC4|nr:tRNA (guanosine(18)-2'-O)-methyltransferase TrmH [Gayadomonas joobiniege]
MTPARLARLKRFFDNRQTDLTVCLEHVHKTHNLSAIVRTADAVGVHNVHAIMALDNPLRSGLRTGTARGTQNWVNVHKHDQLSDALQTFKAQGMQLVATHLSDTAIDFREVDYTKPTAILLGQEKYGISKQALAAADQHIMIPMVGMVQSLNVSVASALILYEAQAQREKAGLYGRCTLDEAEQQRLLFERGHPVFAELCIRKGLPYPYINQEGEIEADDDWWQKMQAVQTPA